MLYRKYRPQKFEEVFGQEAIVRTLRNSLEHESVSHAYLFAGPRGTGKTSVARILATLLEAKDLDLIEIDAASNRGIDDVRNLREQVNFLPTSGPKKLYILDEAHMLTTEAFNALLKTLEEPPEHVHFVLCTTEPYKIPDTIISRCQRFDFALATESLLQDYIGWVAKQEKIKIEKEAISLLSVSAGGSFRDALVLLEKVKFGAENKAGKKIGAGQVRSSLGLVNDEQVETFVDLLINEKSLSALEMIDALSSQGADIKSFVEAIISSLRKRLREQVGKKSATDPQGIGELIRMITGLIEVSCEIRNSPIPSLPIELFVVGWSGAESSRLKTQNLKLEPGSGEGGADLGDKTKTDDKQEPTDRTAPKLKQDEHLALSLQQAWGQILAEVKPFNHSVEALLKGCEPSSYENGILTLRFSYQFHKERINDQQNRQLVEEVASKVLGGAVRLHCVLGERKGVGRPGPKNLDALQLTQESNSAKPLNAESVKTTNSNKDDLFELAQEVLGGQIIE